MLIVELMESRWKRGNVTKKQLVRLLNNYIGNDGKVIELDKDVQVKIDYVKFLRRFGSDRAVDKIAATESKRLHDKILNAAVRKIKSIMPPGWLLTGSFYFGVWDVVENDGREIVLTIKRDWGKVVGDGGVYYHFTMSDNLEGIMRNGLEVRSNRRLQYDQYIDRVFMTEDLPPYELVREVLIGMWGEGDPNVAVIEVNVPDDVLVFKDDQSEGVFVREKIAPERLKVVYNGLLSDYGR